MAYSQIVSFDVLRSLAFGSISGTYAALGSVFAFPMRMICISNNTKGDMFFSFTNGSTPSSSGSADNLFVPAGGFKLLDLTSNAVSQPQSVWCINKGTQVWVRQSTAPTSGTVYLEAIYGQGET